MSEDPQICKGCGDKKFFVTTTGIEVCSACYKPTGYLTRATNRLSTEQIALEEELIVQRKRSRPS